VTGDIIGDYEKLIAQKWKEHLPLNVANAGTKSETGSSNISPPGIQSGFLTLTREVGAQFFGGSENYVCIITKDGKYYAAFSHLRKSSEGEIHSTREDIREFQDKDVKVILPDNIIVYFLKFIEKTYKVKPNFIRIIDAELIQGYVDFFSKYAGDSTQNVPLSSIVELFSRWMVAILAGKWTQYPEPPISIFLRNIASKYDNLFVKILASLTKKKFNQKPAAILIELPHGIIPFRFIPTRTGGKITPLEQGKARPTNWEDLPEFLHQERSRLKVGRVISFRLQDFLNVVKEVVITPFPITKTRWEAIGQRGLYLFKNYGETWATSPSPLAINTLLRFLLRFLGYNYNIWKFSYWYAPSAISNFLVEATGGAGTILCLYRSRIKKAKVNNVQGFTIQIENAAITRIEATDPQFVTSIYEKVKTFYSIPWKAKEAFYLARQNYPNLTNVLFLSEEFFEQLCGKLLGLFLSIHPLKLFSVSRSLKQLKDPRNFYMYPETVEFQYIRKIGGFKLLGWISRLFFDRHEF